MDKEKFVKDLTALVSFETVTGQPNGFTEAMEFIKEQISTKAHIELLPNNDEPLLLASNIKTKTPDICYLVHLDVVPGKPEQFKLKVENGNAYGRGVSDMKFSIPIGYTLLNEIIAKSSKVSFMLAITSDEERGGFHGAGFLADEYKLEPKLLIVPDGGDGFVLVNKSKGVCQIKISMEGKPAHSSQPWLGENALSPILKTATELMALYETANAKEGWHTTMNVGVLTGGKQFNQVAADAQLGIDFRFPPEQDSVESLTEKVKAIAGKIDSRLTVEVVATGIAAFTDPKHPALQLFLDTLKNKTGGEIPIQGEHSSNDARHFNKYAIPYIMTKPSGGDIHGNNEFINIESTLLLHEALSDFIDAYAANTALLS